MSEETKSEPIAYLHTLDSTDGIEENEPSRRLTFSPENPFGKPGVNYSEEYPWTVEPLYRGDEITRLRSDLAAVTAERDRMREALKPFADGVDCYTETATDEYPVDYGHYFLGHLRRARDAIKGVTEPPR